MRITYNVVGRPKGMVRIHIIVEGKNLYITKPAGDYLFRNFLYFKSSFLTCYFSFPTRMSFDPLFWGYAFPMLNG